LNGKRKKLFQFLTVLVVHLVHVEHQVWSWSHWSRSQIRWPKHLRPQLHQEDRATCGSGSATHFFRNSFSSYRCENGLKFFFPTARDGRKNLFKCKQEFNFKIATFYPIFFLHYKKLNATVCCNIIS
jgi:hypothetical protein